MWTLHHPPRKRAGAGEVASSQLRDSAPLQGYQRGKKSITNHLVSNCVKQMGYLGCSRLEGTGCQCWELFSMSFSLDGRVGALQACPWMCRCVLPSPPARPGMPISHKGRALLLLTSGSLTCKVLKDMKQMKKVRRKHTEHGSFLLTLLKGAEEAVSPSLRCPQKDPGGGCWSVASLCCALVAIAPGRGWSFKPVRALVCVSFFQLQMSPPNTSKSRK